MYRQLHFTLLILSSLVSWAQVKSSIKGQAVTVQGIPVEGVHIQIQGTSFGTTTDNNGQFELKGLAEGEYVLSISHLAFTSQTISARTGNDNQVSITLHEDPLMLSQVYVISSRDQLFSKIPGSVSYLDQNELVLLKPVTGNEVFRRIPGLNVVDEEGAGLRVNIGIRGLDPDRSRNVLMMEDGIPVALNPYGEPEMYYTPAMDRMSGVEVLKGSGQILYGPQTIGGVINYITADPSEDEQIRFRLQGGEGGYLSALGSYGNTFNKTGIQLNYLRKQANEMGPTRFRVNDFSAKFKMALSDKSTLGIKLGAYSEVSNSTYVGLTQRMYDIGGNDYTVLMPNDELDVDRYLMSFTHQTHLSQNLTLQSMLYGYTTTRNWRRQDYVYNSYTDGVLNPPPADWTGVVWGDESVAGGAIYLRNRTGNRDRQFEVLGWEQKINYQFQIGSINNTLTAGYRYLYERAYEQRINGSTATAKSGALVSDEIRTGSAIALYFLDKISLSSKWDVSPGLRAEFYKYQREILREASTDVNEVAENSVRELIPGIGLNFRPNTKLNFFTGIHRGYAPPRVKDAIDFSLENPVLELEAETSWNMELGLRSQLMRGLYAELTWFHMDFDNQIIPSSQSIGGSGFGVTNAGRTLHRGVEAAVNMNSNELLGTGWLIALDINGTYTQAEYNADRLVNNGDEEVNVNGNRLPYAPELTLSTALNVESSFGTGLRFTYTYVGNQFTDELNTVVPSNNGRIGQMPHYNVLDATLYHRIPRINAQLNLSVKNLTDERYISTRRPEGIRVGLPRFITAGFEIKL
ncbi:MAG: TonB-dependent receptor [Cyclobacteriaceae bacterium]|jgi:Fe(3+) dicitrate transport protein|nr:TonB-dependent receptor [Cyclobacteriaceae bacterium]